MAASVHDQAHLAGLFDAGEVARLFSASAEIRAMLVVFGALATAQAKAGVIPELSAAAIHRASMEVQIDPGALRDATATNGVSVPALVAAFRDAMNAPEHAAFVHWGATSQDIIDTGLMLRLRQARHLILADCKTTLNALADLAETHAETPVVARTYGQQAAPTSFGAIVASWGWPVLSAAEALQSCVFPVSLAGAVGTGSALGPDPSAIRASVADALNLSDLGRAWHTDRTPVLTLADAATKLSTGLGKLGEDVIAMTQSEVAEIQLGAAGASSTMPQKQNPVGPSVLVAISNLLPPLNGALQSASVHRFQRDGAAWFTEWMILPQIVLGAATAAQRAANLGRDITAAPDTMAAKLQGDGLLFSEALSFELAKTMPRPEAQATTKRLAADVRAADTSLPDVAHAAFPDLPADLFDASAQLGTAPQDACNFAKKARNL